MGPSSDIGPLNSDDAWMKMWNFPCEHPWWMRLMNIISWQQCMSI